MTNQFKKIHALECCVDKLRKLHRYHESLEYVLDQFKDEVDGIELLDEKEIDLVSSHILAVYSKEF